ncbi:hypothetical protein A3A09_03150 [Candidatus Nomurabacteria bacterium RIFCSPLOWO2_01_FULL_42_20]|uniref:Uncharacterized protein n=1 Tax=Candidatus Nomurabacteria bacterium RIFCSPHIGHO2_01_FULL_42_16 TaxID=1801743 RepID=A0A1F6VJL6_9BACT|nr:MAG: hypothetical protein A2824_03250 [Candidatus Nomurabacteria bacterium RIFCSPHIGHO2_01_FULL_42_16]OGI92602.1 MAG: hypothetical protein A3A09_03150 [Candidatus Nomurabacteria bacterium RIFCSPLOWO2_01_FULL_42_20]
MENLEKEKYKSFFESRHFKRFLEYRKIKAEDINLAKELFEIDKQNTREGSEVSSILHNFFQFAEKKSAERLESKVIQESSQIKKRMFEIFLYFTKNYDWYTSQHLNVLLESSEWMQLNR